MIIVSDTTPLRYLIETDEIHVLEKLFGEVIIPHKQFNLTIRVWNLTFAQEAE